MSSVGSKVLIPNSLKMTIQNIKEITGNHSDDDIYTMLKECSMDPNETTQKLLLQDTFHEVKRKKDRKKESLNNRESSESHWKSGPIGRGGRGSRVIFSPQTSNDAGGSKSSGPEKYNGINQIAEKGAPTLPNLQETKKREKVSGTSLSSSFRVTANGHHVVAAGPSSVVDRSSALSAGSTSSSNNSSSSGAASSSTVCFSLAPVLEPSNDLRLPGAVGSIKREMGSQQHPSEPSAGAPEIGNFSSLGKNPGKAPVSVKNHHADLSQTTSTTTHGSYSTSRPSSNYGSRTQQLIGPQKAVSNKEWKPKATVAGCQGAVSTVPSGVTAASGEGTSQSVASEEASSKLQKKLEDLHLPRPQHVIIANHIHVPESEKTKFSFGSLGANFGVTTSHVSDPGSDKNAVHLSDNPPNIEAAGMKLTTSRDTVHVEVEEFPQHPQSPRNVSENVSSGAVEVSSSVIEELNESKQDNTQQPESHHHSILPNSSNYSFGLMPPVLETQLSQTENCESQAHDGSCLHSFVVHQPFDPASYYAQLYSSGPESDGCVSPFVASGVNAKYNNVSVLPTPNSHCPREGGILSTAGPAPLMSQAAGLMQSSVAVNQQSVPVFRPPTGVHISHYPTNYIPYGHYISPFYVPPPAVHQFLGNGAFPQQPQVYPASPAITATGIKYSFPYKPGTNGGNPPHIVMPTAYCAYGSSSAGYNPSSTATAGNSNSNEDLGASVFKENNVYGQQQSEGSAVWVAAPGREISSLPNSSFYHLPPQGQQMSFTPAQAGHGSYAGIYHPAQAVTAATVHPLLQQSQTMAGVVDMVGPGGNVYQQSQHGQMNWPSNY